MHDVSGRSIAQDHEQPLEKGEAPSKGMLIVVPLYKGPELLRRLSQALLDLADELRMLDASVLFINDSPDHAGLAAELERSIPRMSAKIDVSVLTNPENLGFLRSANRAMALARDTKRDLLLLNSDTVPRPGAFKEMAAVARLDPMIGAVSPRSDNATICDSPYFDELRGGGEDRSYAAHKYIERHLPRFTYIPTTVGFCMLVRWLMLEEFGSFDEIYGAGYNEEIDFVRRINRCGYRAVLANHAYVHHQGEASFSRSGISRAERNEVNAAILLERYPETTKTIQSYFEGPEYQTHRLLGGLVPTADGRLNVLFDCRKLGLYHSGTHEHMIALLRAFVAAHAGEYVSHVVCEEEAFHFHGLDAIAGLAHVSERQVPARRFAAVMRIGQPFHLGDLELLESAAPVSGVLMLDTIALDCQHLDETGLGVLWQRLCLSVDVMGFNSRFSADQFNRRFSVPDRISQFVSLCSIDLVDYTPASAAPISGETVLVVGNHFHHKHVRATIDALRAVDPHVPILVLGIKCEGDNIESYESGLMSEELVASLYDRARVVLLPSHYEGFGLPILHGLARSRPVIARDLPSAREIRASCSAGANLYLASTTREMVRLALRPPAWQPSVRDPETLSWSWREAAGAIADGIALGIEKFDYQVCFSRRVVANTARLRLELAASGRPGFIGLPDPGQGYMLGRSLEEQLNSHHTVSAPARLLLEIGFAAHPEHALTETVPKSGRQIAHMKLRADKDCGDFEGIQRHLLSWLNLLRVGGHVQLRLHPAILALDDEFEPTVIARVPLLASGLTVDWFGYQGGWLILRGTKRTDWQMMLSGPPGDLQFVHHLYRQMLGRHPDTEGANHYFDALAAGVDRTELLRIFLCSGERRSLIGRHLARRVKREAMAN